jgi:hypothetical protein
LLEFEKRGQRKIFGAKTGEVMEEWGGKCLLILFITCALHKVSSLVTIDKMVDKRVGACNTHGGEKLFSNFCWESCREEMILVT